MKRFYQMSKEELFSIFGTTEKGLSSEKAIENSQKYGKNVLESGKNKSKLLIFLEQYKDFLVIILIISAIISGILGDIESSAVIFIVITLNAILGTVQTLKAEHSLNSLKAMSSPTAKVIRDGELQVIDSVDVTVGDMVIIEAGDYICADGRIIENASLKADESALTGESEPIEKDISVITEEKPIGDRLNMLYSGCFATYGRATMLVTGTGMDTEIGKIAALLKNTEEKKTPLQITLDNFGKSLSIGIIIICAVVFAMSIARGNEIVDAFVFAVALAVAAIPEALSSIVTIVLSTGTQKLAKENAIIRKLRSVEGLGSVSVICSDKTGTLTQNKMTVKSIYSDEKITNAAETLNDVQSRLLIAAVLCNDSTEKDGEQIGDPTETALTAYAAKHGFTAGMVRSEHKRISEIPFDSDRKLMSTVHEFGGELKMLTKGAVDVLLPHITMIAVSGGDRPFTASDSEKVKKANLSFSGNGLRVLAVCEKNISSPKIQSADETGYTLLGLVAMQDPPREESAAAVTKCKAAAIRPIMITGDHLITAKAIAKQIGILEDGTRGVEGSDIDSLTDEELQDFVSDVSVYARVSPEHKIRIVKAWQSKGNIVSMTGDGVNDAPALKQADIGVAMGITGSEVAKDAASMVLADDNFATIVKAIENGRNLYLNIQRAIRFLLSGNAAAIAAVIYCSIFGFSVPFEAVHLLFINLLTDSLPAIALGLEPHSDSVMREKPRSKNSSILSKPILKKIGIDGLIISAVTLAAFHIGAARNAACASTMAFAVLCLSRLIHGFNCKSDRPVIFTKKMWNNKSMILAFIIGFVLLNAVLLIPPMHGIFGTAVLTPLELISIYGLSLASFIVIQITKLFGKNQAE